MKTKFFFYASFFIMSVCTAVQCHKNTQELPEKANETSGNSIQNMEQLAAPIDSRAEVVPNQYVLLFNENIVPSFSNNPESSRFTNRDEKKRAADAYERLMEPKIRKLALDKLGITSDMTKAVFSTVATGMVVQLKSDHYERLKSQLSQIREVLVLAPDYVTKIEENNTSEQSTTTTNAMAGQVNSWGVDFVGSKNYVGINWAWIMDTGIDYNHPDLNVGVGLGANFSASLVGMLDLNGHGTHVAGIIGAKNNNIGALGVAAGVAVIPVKVMNDNGTGNASSAVLGLNHIAKFVFTGDVINMSIGSTVIGADKLFLEFCIFTISFQGAYVVMAAGNDGIHANNQSPARLNGNRIFTISAADEKLNLASYSNYGTGPVDFAAPGSNIYSTYKFGGYTKLSGTSMATPFVAGILLANSGVIKTRGTLKTDKDAILDPLAVLK